MAWSIKKVNRIPTHCGVVYESVRSLARGHIVRVCIMAVYLEYPCGGLRILGIIQCVY